jgi:succinylglutamate desuccinylase
LKAQK